MADFLETTGLPFEPRRIRELRRRTQPPLLKNVAFAGLISRRFSIYFSAVFIRAKVHPDTITLLMILSGIAAAAALFAGWAITAVVLFNLWFILDCSDGEVARHNGKLNPLGPTIDLMAHIVNHPLLIMGFAYHLRDPAPSLVYSGALLLACADLSLRLLNFIPDSPGGAAGSSAASAEYHVPRQDGFSLKMSLMRILIEFPNFLMFATFTMIADHFMGWRSTYWLFLSYAFSNFLIVSVVQAKKIRRLIWNA
jgi:phosphatidylserine synthase